MNCKETRKAFVALLDGDLALTERAPVELHLDRCIACWARFESLRSQPALLRTVWRARIALSSVDGLLDAGSRFRRQILHRVPVKIFPMAAAVTIMVVVATYGIQRWTEPAAAPEASPVRHAPAPSRPPLSSTEVSTPGAPAPASPMTEAAEEHAPKPRAEPTRMSRDRARPVAKAQAALPTRSSVSAPAAKAEPGTVWALGNSRDEQNVLPESETVRRDRD